MTNYGIPLCYGTTAGTKQCDRANYNKDNIPRPEILNQVQNDEGYTRANYNIDRDTHIGDSSLYARNDGHSNATTNNHERANYYYPTKEKILLTKEDILPTKERILLTKEEILPIKERILLITVEILSTKERILLTTVENVSTKEEILSTTVENVSTKEGILSTKEENVSTKEESVSIKEESVSIKGENILTGRIQRKSQGKNGDDESLAYLYAINGSTLAGAPGMADQVRHDEGYDRANYNIDGDTHIGDSSLYARNDEDCNATADKKHSTLGMTDTAMQLITRDASASSATQGVLTIKKYLI
jgi:hypothetical protein